MKQLSLIIMFSWVLGFNIKAQCNNKLMELAAAHSGNDALFIRDFRVKFEEGTMKRPSPVARYQVLLNEGIHYRFNVVNATDFEGKAILQLYERNRILGSTFDVNTKADLGTFDFICDKTETYQVLMSFREGKRGCAVGVMSLVISDSLYTTFKDKPERELEKLYIGIENELTIAATNIPGGTLEVDISCGEIKGNNGRYIVTVEKEGITTIKVVASDNSGQISEIDSMDFLVQQIPVPYATFSGLQGGLISKHDIEQTNHLSLIYTFDIEEKPYEIIEFTISKRYNELTGERSYNSKLTVAQRAFLQSLKKGDYFVITNIIAKGPDSTTHQLKPLMFIVD